MKKPVVLFGLGSFAEVVHFYLTHDSDYEVVAFTVTSDCLPENREFLGLPVVPFETVEQLYPPTENAMFVSMGYRNMNHIRERFYNEAKTKGYQLITYVCSKATWWGDTQLGDNVFIFEDNTIQPFVSIGNNTILWSGNHIGHHSRIGNHCFISSHVVVSGHVAIGDNCFIGVNATFRDNIHIADENLIGPGVVILKSTQPKQAYLPERVKPFAKTSLELL